jgi:inward rectifier potassium channel
MSIRRRQHSTRTELGELAFIKKGISRFDLRDPYHVAVTLSWPQFLAALLGLYLAVNLVFATLYTIVPGAITNARHGNFIDAFFFSFETLATVGYGEMFPGGLYGHLVACAEIICGLAFTAILTGLTFVRFSRPRAKFVFAEYPVVNTHNGKPTLMVRVGNGRAGVLNDAHAKMNVLLRTVSAEGESFRAAHELKLQRSHIPIFPLTWTLMHVMDEKSPLHGFDAEKFVEADARMVFSMEARDPSLSATVYDTISYRPERVRFGKRYADAISTAEDGTPIADMTLISALTPDTGPLAPQPGWTEIEPGGDEGR